MIQFKRYGFWLVSIITLIFTMFFFSTTHPTKKELSILEKIVYTLSKPIEVIFLSSSHYVYSTYHSFIDLKDARKEADELHRENAELKVKLRTLDDIVLENNRLRKLLNLSDRTSVKFVTCEVTSSDPSFVYKNVRINQGSKNGLQPGMGVVAEEGVVGVVMRVSINHSDVLLMVDPNSNLDVIVARNRRRGVLQGGTAGSMQFKYLERGSSILVGDEIVTSGLTGSFPSGILVGKVTNIRVNSDGVTQTIEVKPAVDFSDISEALVLLNPNREVDVIRKVGGVDWMKKLLEANAEKSGG
ncbi:rod shape-determining protein MreC [Silvanigrella paludirubra]|jgi:rod shape-determining protein MreC|uniref:Cell shape-determining protein MreC n=1 Tax=Silvanigrella paludirubra TaxID=2499159 RepID=A0A6N6VYR4_9BACT|nr:rod shape-determining protein MreC [Silvanigrella paludirubra]KAB8040342.1 rod shape-determining protein MreC [Silvanigrella paludirubra]